MASLIMIVTSLLAAFLKSHLHLSAMLRDFMGQYEAVNENCMGVKLMMAVVS